MGLFEPFYPNHEAYKRYNLPISAIVGYLDRKFWMGSPSSTPIVASVFKSIKQKRNNISNMRRTHNYGYGNVKLSRE